MEAASSGNGGLDGQGQPQVKRRRKQRACQTCQDRKTRCDSQRPACSPCQRRGVADKCAYDSPVNPESTIDQLKERLDRLEKTPDAKSSSGSMEPTPGPHPIAPPSMTYQQPSGMSSRLATGNWSFTPEGHNLDAEHLVSEVDGLATVSSIEDEGSFGASSTIAFVRMLSNETGGPPNAQNSDDSVAWGVGSATNKQPRQRAPETIREKESSAAVYPPRRVSDNFLHCFWEFVHPLFPVLHKVSFMGRYASLWSDSEMDKSAAFAGGFDEPIFSSTLNIMFALGCQYSELVPIAERPTLAQDFYQRSRRVYNLELLDSMSIPAVQMLLLTAVFLQSSREATRCWNVVGLAIRVAQSLGLHFEPPNPPNSQLDREMRRRVWYTCFSLDKLLGMTFGRPAMISTNWKVPIPSMIDDEYLLVDGEGKQPVDVAPRLGLFVSSSNLFIILDDILSSFYSVHSQYHLTSITKSEGNPEKIISDVMALNRRLDRFANSIPEYLRKASESFSLGSQHDPSVVLQQQILRCRYLYTRVLLLRPLIYLTTKIPSLFKSSSLAQDGETVDEFLLKQLCKQCVKTAQDLINTVYNHLESSHHSPGWHSVYFTFASAVIMLAARLCPAVDMETTTPEFDTSWNSCLVILEHYKDQVKAAKRAILVLQELRQKACRSENTDNDINFEHEHATSLLFDSFNETSALNQWITQDFNDTDWLGLLA